ncbi:ATP-dependent helicase [Frankia sp. AgB1.9]|uniref:UvrD-helicase domain-containing protein n=1 Tax=unclassified Frankia TaxID=2632575 RepID=UPI001931ABC3|nr:MULTISPECIES: UvrD-helicase domain-containing protein [unclassified Frankia]MBL7488392.1 ATP-dependent helicase [Frankia sp. AgW1.1]MBL7547660.1 ATP-dependent helicase [Frankia sp. AgB1.9]MBL7624095.1 ATP-dependent helicase [Frankia sp. AgB1.8]
MPATPIKPGFDPSPAQRLLIETPGSQVVRACPGAGKTQSVAERFWNRPGLENDRRGVALLSFTNAAIAAAEARCRDHPDLLRAPNFLGTIDRFINRYIVGPLRTAERGEPPTFVNTWDALPESEYGARADWQLRLNLAWFSFALDGTPTLDRVPGDLKDRVLRRAAPIMASVLADAKTRWWSLTTRRGYVDCELARHLMRSYFANRSHRERLKRQMAHRFGEVIIDEYQDSSDDDAYLIRFLKWCDLSIVMVGDVDQAIYGFRQDTPADLDALANLVKAGKPLDGNFRSTPAICELVDSLRHGPRTDVACGRWQDDSRPVYVLRTNRPPEAAGKITDLAARHGFMPDQIVVLSHGGNDARTYAGAAKPPEPTSAGVERLAQAAATICDGRAEPRARVQAMAAFENIMCSLGKDGLGDLPKDDFLVLCDLNPRQFRTGCLRLARCAAPYEMTPREYRAAIKSGVAGLGWDTLFPNILRKLRVTKGVGWQHAPASDISAALAWRTVHGYKGLQSPAVAVVIPKPSGGGLQEGVSHWEDQKDSEARRVLYVAASRAEQLLMLVVDNSQFATVVEILKRDDVPYEEA